MTLTTNIYGFDLKSGIVLTDTGVYIPEQPQTMTKSETTPRYAMQPLPIYISKDGIRYEFIRVAEQDKDGCVALSQLTPDEIVIAPGFIYRWLP